MTIETCLRRGLFALACSAGVATASPAIVVVDAPSNLGLRPPAPGVEPGARKLAAALRGTGFVDRLGARDAGRVDAPPYSPDADAATGFRNGTALAAYSRTLADRLGRLLADDAFVVVLGGDCSVLLGAGVALKRRGRYGLAFVDAHDDYTYPRDAARYRGRYTAAGLDLGLATGHGPAALTAIDGASPYFAESDVVHLGLVREAGDAAYGDVARFERSPIHILDRAAIERRGAAAVGASARERLAGAGTDGYWIHVDADVLDASVMPAVDSPNGEGISFTQLRALLAALLESPRAVGLELTIYDPDLDPTGAHGRNLADAIVGAFADSGRFSTPPR